MSEKNPSVCVAGLLNHHLIIIWRNVWVGGCPHYYHCEDSVLSKKEREKAHQDAVNTQYAVFLQSLLFFLLKAPI